MSTSVCVAVDAMGGDSAPGMVVEGMARAKTLYPETRFLLFGPEDQLAALIAAHEGLGTAVTVVHAEKVVTADEKPSQALRHGRDASMGLAIQAVKAGDADVAISAGNTGALMALAKFTLRTKPGIDRPALVSPMPTLKGESVMLDLGANIECSSENLVQFAVMGAAYARIVLGFDRPTVGLLNVGSEDLKGRDAVKEAADVLKLHEARLPFEYCGFVEGDGIGAGDVDVIVTDGFTGNVALKTAEGTAKLIGTLLERAFKSSTLSKVGYGFARSGMMSLKDHLDPNNHNGGVFLGLNGLVVKSHGGASAHGYASALSVAIDMAKSDIIRLIKADLEDMRAALDVGSGDENAKIAESAAGDHS